MISIHVSEKHMTQFVVKFVVRAVGLSPPFLIADFGPIFRFLFLSDRH